MPSLFPQGMHTLLHTVSGDTHTHTHTHTHAGGMTVEGVLCIYPILASSPKDIQEQWAASDAAPGDQVQVLGLDLVRVRTDKHLLFLHVFIVGVLWGEPG